MSPVDTEKLARLTLKQREVLKKIARGIHTKEIACQICRSPKTVEDHRAAIQNNLQLFGAVNLTRFAIRVNLIKA